MKKSLFLMFALFLGWNITFAAPTPELLENLTTQILEQQTKTKSAKEVLDQLTPLFTQCASSHKDKAIQSVCKIFLEKQFTSLKKKWITTLTGWFAFYHIGKISSKDRLSQLGFEYDIPNRLKLNNRYPVDKFEYGILSLPEFWFSFFTPFLPKKYKPSGMGLDCNAFKQQWKENIDRMKKKHPEYVGQIIDMEERLKNTICHHSFMVQRAPRESDTVYISSLIDTIGNQSNVSISRKQLKNEDKIENFLKKEHCWWKDLDPSEIWFDNNGTAYYSLNDEYSQVELGTSLSGLVLWYTGDISKFHQRFVGVWKNLQAMIAKWEVKSFLCRATLYLQFTQTPQTYYEITLSRPSLLIGQYIAVDLNNPDGTSSFLSK